MTENNPHNLHVFNNNYPYNFNPTANIPYQNMQFNPQYENMNGIQNFNTNDNFGMANNNNQHYNPQNMPQMFNQSMNRNENSNLNYNSQMYPQQQSQFNLIYPQKIQPYNDKDFLCKTFNFKIQYIRAFLTLIHQEKLCFFMYVQQKRLTGKIEKEKDYKQLLNKIADIVNPTRKILNPVQILTEQQIKQKILQNQVNQFCDQQFKRLDVKLQEKQDQQEFTDFTQPKQENQFNQFEGNNKEIQNLNFQQEQQWNYGTSQQIPNNHQINEQQYQLNLQLQRQQKLYIQQDYVQNHDVFQIPQSNIHQHQNQQQQQEWGWADNSQKQQNLTHDNQIGHYAQQTEVMSLNTPLTSYPNYNNVFIDNNSYQQNTKPLKKDQQISQINVDKYVIKADSIWDLQLNQQQIKKSQPSIRQIFGIHQANNQQPLNSNINSNSMSNMNNPKKINNTHQEVDLFDLIQTNNNPSSYNYQGNQHNNNMMGYNDNSNDLFFLGQNQQTNQNLFVNNNRANQQILPSFNKQKYQEQQQQEEWQEAEQAEQKIEPVAYTNSYNYNNQVYEQNVQHQNRLNTKNYHQENNQQQQQEQEWVQSLQQTKPQANPQQSMNFNQNQQQHQYSHPNPSYYESPMKQNRYPNKDNRYPNKDDSQTQQEDIYQIDQKTLSYSNYLNRYQNSNSLQQQNNGQNSKYNQKQKQHLYHQQNSYSKKTGLQVNKSNHEDQDQFYQANYQQPLPQNNQQIQRQNYQKQTFVKQIYQDHSAYYHNQNQYVPNNIKQSLFTGSFNEISNSQQQSFQELPEIDQKYLLLQPLKIKLLPQELTYLSKKIKSDAFQCQTQFYENLINYLEKFNFQFQTEGNVNLNSTSLSIQKLESNSFKNGKNKNIQKQKITINLKQADIKFLQNQKIIVQKIHQLTKKYTQAVEQDEQQLVVKSIKQSKQFYQTLSSNINKTKAIVKSILQTQQNSKKQLNVNQAGIFYSLARLNMDTGVKEEYIEKLITNFKRDNSNQTKNSFISQSLMLFLLQKMNQINYLKNITETICSYLLDQYQKYQQNSQKIQEISRQTNTPPYLLNQKVFKQQGYLAYLKGLIRIAIVCQRLITLTKLTSLKLEINLIKTSKFIKEMKNLQLKNSSLFIQQQPMIYQDYASKIICLLQQNRSIYELHSVLMNLMKQQSICKICLGKSEQQLKGDFRDQNAYSWCHYGCYNLLINAFQAKS